MLRHGCDHVQPRCLCLSRRGIGRRPPPWRDIQADALGRVAKIRAPFPASNGNVRFGAMGCDAHLLRIAPRDRAYIAVPASLDLLHLVTYTHTFATPTITF